MLTLTNFATFVRIGMKKSISVFLLFFLVISYILPVRAQENYAEQYYTLRNTARTDTACTDSLFLLLYYLHLDDISLADSISEDFLQYAGTQNNDYLNAKANLIKGVIRNEQGKNIEAIPFTLTAIKYFHNQVSQDVCFAYQILAFTYNAAGNYTLARESNQKALAIAEALQNEVLISNSYNDIGRSYNYDKQYTAAIPWFRKVIALDEKMLAKGEKQKSVINSHGYNNLGLCYRELGIYDSALFYTRKALAVAESKNDYHHIAYAFSDLGATYSLKKEHDTAISYLQKAAKIWEERKNGFDLAYTYLFLGDSYSGKNEKQNALNYYRKAIALNTQNNNLKQRYEIYHQLSEMFYRFKNFDSAYIYNEKHAVLRDSVQRAQSKLSTAATIASYELDKKEANIQTLQQKNKLNRLILAVVIAVFLLLVVLGLWLLNRVRLRRKETELQAIQQLQKEKERIARDLHDNVGGQLSYIIYSLDGINEEDKNKRSEITESINQSVRSVIGSLRETIWAISGVNITLQDFSDKLKVYTRNLFKHTATVVKFNEDLKSNRELNALLGLNLYRICQEILTNAFKHAGASEVTVDLKTEGEKLTVHISDNGSGFDMSQKKEECYGLQNARKRAGEFGISLTLDSAPNKGTQYKLIV